MRCCVSVLPISSAELHSLRCVGYRDAAQTVEAADDGDALLETDAVADVEGRYLHFLHYYWLFDYCKEPATAHSNMAPVRPLHRLQDCDDHSCNGHFLARCRSPAIRAFCFDASARRRRRPRRMTEIALLQRLLRCSPFPT